MASLYQDACDFFFWFSWDSCQCYRISRVCNILLGDMSDFRFARESQDSLISLGMLAISRDVSIIYIRGIWNLILQISSMSKNELMKLLMEFSQDSLEFINFFFEDSAPLEFGIIRLLLHSCVLASSWNKFDREFFQFVLWLSPSSDLIELMMTLPDMIEQCCIDHNWMNWRQRKCTWLRASDQHDRRLVNADDVV